MNLTLHFKHSFLLVCCFVLFSTAGAQAQSIIQSSFGKGLQFVAADSSFGIRFGTRIQLRYQGENNPATKNWDDQFLVRRARLKFQGFAYSPKLTYELELGLSNNDIGNSIPDQTNNASNIVLDAVVGWEMIPGLVLYVGQTKLPGNRERIVSSQKMQFVDRSLLNARFNIDRDAGLQLHHEHEVGQMVLREIVSVSMGEGRNITINNQGGYDYTGRFEILPFGAFEDGGDYSGSDLAREETPKLAIAAAYDFNHGATREQGQLGDFLSRERNLHTMFIDAMFKYRGFSAMAEYADKHAPRGPVVLVNDTGGVEETFVTGNAFNLQAGYLFPSNWELAGRYTTFNPDAETQIIPEDQYTLGLSKYIVGHSLKVQGDATLRDFEGTREAYVFRLQLELAL